MTQDLTTTIQTEHEISTYFEIQSHMLATRTADAYRAVDRSRNEPVCLWVMRHQFQLESDTVRRFLARMHQLDQTEPPVSDIVAFGVDSVGTSFALLPPLDGYVITAGNIESSEGERRFIGAARLLDRMHTMGIACGDICGSSFWVNRHGDVRFVGVMGSFDGEAASTAMAPPVDTLPFLPPEQRGGAAPHAAGDIFALGVLGYHLVTKSFPYGQGLDLMAKKLNLNDVPPLARFIGVPPVWAEEVFLKCLAPRPEDRFQSAAEVLERIGEIRNRAFSEQTAPVQRGERAPEAARRSGANQVEQFKSIALSKPEDRSPAIPDKPRRWPVLALGVGACLVLAFLLLPGVFQRGPAKHSNLEEELKKHRAVVTDQGLREAIDIISVDEKAIKEKALQIEKVQNSDDPIAHDILVKSAREAESPQLREVAERALVNRLRRLDMMRSAEQVRQWLRTLRTDHYPDSYEALLRSTDKALPEEVRFSLLRQAYASQPRVALRFAVALALDLKQLDAFQPLIAQLVGDSLHVSDAEQYSTLSLILAHPDLSLVFGEDIIQLRDSIPDKDILWLLKVLAERNDINVRVIANIAVERGVLSPIRQEFLSVIRDKSDIPVDVLQALIKASAGILTAEDLGSFGRWYDTASERVLLAICADTENINVLRETFDLLSAKSLTIEPSASLVDWVRTNQWENRWEFASLIGTLAFVDKMPPDQVEKAFSVLDSISRDSELLDILLAAQQPVIVKEIVDRYSDLLGLGTLLNLLSHPDPVVRISAVQSLKGFNDIGALKIIIDHYERERDPKVRKVYEDTFWVIKRRKTDKSESGHNARSAS